MSQQTRITMPDRAQLHNRGNLISIIICEPFCFLRIASLFYGVYLAEF